MKGPANTALGRREFIRLAGLAGIGLVGAACAPGATPTPTPTKAPADATAKPAAAATPAAPSPEQARVLLHEAAKKEGQVAVYSTGTSKDMDAYRKAFAKTYPGVEIKEWMATSEQVLEKLMTESKAGRVNADFFMLPLDHWLVVHKEGLSEKWDPPERAGFPPDAIDTKGFYTMDNAAIHVISYNTQLVPAAEAPKNYEHLLKPFFKGKLGLETESYSWFTQRMKIWGKDKTLDYCRKLAAQQPKFVKGFTTLADAVVSGEVWAAVNVYQHRVEDQKGKGAPVKWEVDEPTGAEVNALGLTKGAPHPNAGKLFLDWRLSQEGQEVTFKSLARYPMRKGVSLPPELQVKVALPSLEAAAETLDNAKLFKEIFGLI